MLIFVDESGDTGFKFGKGSSRYFTVAAVRFWNHEAAIECDQAIGALRDKLGHKGEFHFQSLNHAFRVALLNEVCNFEFDYSAFILNKKELWSSRWRDTTYFYTRVARWVIENILSFPGSLRDAIITFDRRGEARFRGALERSILDRMAQYKGATCVKKIKSARSDSNNLIQLADVVCGAVARSVNQNRGKAGCYREIVKAHEARTQFWP